MHILLETLDIITHRVVCSYILLTYLIIVIHKKNRFLWTLLNEKTEGQTED
jgi:EamA domain-containing membrane protein RarD